MTGASGFVGQSLIHAWNANYTINAISRQDGSFLKGVHHLVGNWENLSNHTHTYHTIIHLAGLAHDTRSKKSEQEYMDVNAGLTRKLVQWINATQKSRVKFIYLSSVKVYGNTEDLITEASPTLPDSVYGKSKLAAENIIRTELVPMHQAYILQPVLIYGKGQKGNLQALEKWLNLRLPNIFSRVLNKRSLLYMGNLQFVIEEIMQKEIATGTYLVSNDEVLSTGEILQNIGGANNHTSFSLPIPGVFLKTITSFTPGLQQKLLGNLQVSNQKIKKALKIENMPFSTLQGFKLMSTK